MSRYLVDTSWIVDALHGRQDAIDTLADLAPGGLAISIVTYGELYEGAYYASDAAALPGLLLFLEGVELIPLTTALVERFAVLRGSLSRNLRRQIGDFDLLIAATSLEHGLILLTYNEKDFQHIPEIELYS